MTTYQSKHAPPVPMSAPILAALVRDIAIIVAVIVYVIDTL
jgi:hypothetical protein